MSYKVMIVDFNGVFQIDADINKRLFSFLENLQSHKKIAMLTSMESSILTIYRIAGFLDVFDEIYTIDRLTYAKPHPAVFKEAAKDLGVEPGDCVMVDDVQINLDGAERAGMQTILYEDFDTFKQQAESL